MQPLRVLIGGLTIALTLGAASVVAAERRVALVVGNSKYQNAEELLNPHNDAEAIGEVLARLGFEVEVVFDLDQLRMREAFRNFGIKAEGADTALVFYAGHGIQVAGENYLLPVDARLERARDLAYEALPLALILEEVAQARKLGLVILDACRDNPLAEQLRAAIGPIRADLVGRGLARIAEPPAETLVAFSTTPGEVAVDGSGEHSPYTDALLAHIEEPGLELGLLLRKVRDTVLASTADRQEPRVMGALGAEPFYFKEKRPNRRPELPDLAALEVMADAGATPLGIGQPSDPDGDPLSVQVAGVPDQGVVTVGERTLVIGDVLAIEDIAAATYTPAEGAEGPAGSFDFLLKDDQGGAVVGRLKITVARANAPPVVRGTQVLKLPPIPLGIPAPIDPDGDQVTVTVTDVPQRGMIKSADRTLAPGDQLTPEQLTGLVLECGPDGAEGVFAFTVTDSRGASAMSAMRIPTIGAPTAAVALAPPVAQTAQLSPPAESEDTPRPAAKPHEAAPARTFTAARRAYEVIRPSNIRAGPSAEDQRVTSVAAGTTLFVLREVEDRNWYQIETEDGQAGYIYAPLVRPMADEPAAQASESPTEEVAAAPTVAAVPGLKECAQCPEMVMIRPGRFQMGSERGHPSERPVHPVDIAVPFALGKYEVRVDEWQACVDGGGCRSMPDMRRVGADSPVHDVSWEDAQEYIRWLRQVSGQPYRLPTEAEWEYAARGGTTTAYWWGNDPGRGRANCQGCDERWNADAPADVDAYSPNPFGLHGVSGGVMEWVEDCWIGTYDGAPGDATARIVANCTQRVLRGGSWLNDHTYATTSSRLGYDAGVRYRTNGLRIARDLD